MKSSYTGATVLYFDDEGVWATQANESTIRDSDLGKPLKILENHIPAILEIITCHNHIEKAYSVYKTLRKSRDRVEPTNQALLHKIIGDKPARIAMLLTRNKVIACLPESLPTAYRIATTLSVTNAFSPKGMIEMEAIHDLTNYSRSGTPVATILYAHYFSVNVTYPNMHIEDFTNIIKYLYYHGLLTRSFGNIEFGDLKRFAPLCYDYGYSRGIPGYSRGTPIDRYYLDKFIREIRTYVAGHTLEIGGIRENQDRYGFTNAVSYQTIDLIQQPGVDIIGDIHDPNLVEHNSLDSIILFNVLEHCERPWVIIENVYNWLRGSGSVFCMVPNAQRIHGDPKDYWRILPDGMKVLFAKFSTKTFFIYGNPITVIAAMMGVAAEELSSEELNSLNPEYPVATCVFARKSA